MAAASSSARREREALRQSDAVASHGLHEQKVSAAFRGQQLTAVPSDLLTLKNLVCIDLSRNQITRFPGALVAAEMLRLEVLLLQDNLLYVLEDILALASAPRLCELNLLNNPLRLQHNRVYLLEALWSQPGSDESLLAMAHKDEQLKCRGEDSRGGARDVASSAQLRHRSQPHHRRRHSAITMAYRKKLPRKHGFPMLMKLNDAWITDREVKDVEDERGHAIKYFTPRASDPHLRHRGSTSGSPATGASPQLHHDPSRTTRTTEPAKAQTAHQAGATASETLAPSRVDQRRFDGSRMTIKQMLRNEARSAAIPVARVIQRFCIDADTGDEVAERDDAQDCSWTHARASSGSSSAATAYPRAVATASSSASVSADEHEKSEVSDRAEEQAIIHCLFQNTASSSGSGSRERNLLEPAPSVRRASEAIASDDTRSSSRASDSVGDSEIDDDELVEPWNYPISTFDALGSEDRQYVRARSKQSGSTLERDDHFFASSVFLDCVAQAERSRRLTVRAVDLLSQQHLPQQPGSRLAASQSAPALPTSTAAATLVDNMNAKFSKHLDQATYEKVLAFQEKHLSVDSLNIQAAVGDYYQSEHVLQKQRTNQLLSAAQATTALTDRHALPATAAAAATEASIEDSLSKLKLRNAVDLANTLLDPKQQKRMLQTLIDADAQVIEEERVAQEQTAHKFRLALIHARQFTPSDAKQIDALVRSITNKSASPWQRRNWKAVEVQRALEAAKTTMSNAAATPSPAHEQPTQVGSHTNGSDTPVRALQFRSIETVERAAQDPLAGVNSHDLLVRCSEIRPHADKHVKALAQHRDRFLDDEAAWERMRQDPTNVVRRHLKRRLYQHAQEVQIGSTHVVYSSLFH